MAPAKFQLTKLFMVLTMTILQQVGPSSASSPECQWLDKKGEHIENEILIVLDQLQPKEEIPGDCFDEVPHYGFPNNIHELKAAAMVVHTVYNETVIFYRNFAKTLGLPEKDYEKLLSLLRYVMNNLTPCVTNAEQYKNVTERTSNQYIEFENYVQKWGNTACAQIIFWLISKNVQEAVHLSSQMRKIDLMNKTS
ncbi:hypothetical protein XELAEV_18000787mg [Xenopus laevis]|uniref:Type I interferon 12 n=1 Tax=Xenopus laevis TaxID=8355 RepID=A0A1B1FFU5_XENLA|nr:type I interferon 12 [Xenopus laevis]OCT59366.1 hypothetical protein XELAEV_18000787mg [Xenopus laevis]